MYAMTDLRRRISLVLGGSIGSLRGQPLTKASQAFDGHKPSFSVGFNLVVSAGLRVSGFYDGATLPV